MPHPSAGGGTQHNRLTREGNVARPEEGDSQQESAFKLRRNSQSGQPMTLNNTSAGHLGSWSQPHEDEPLDRELQDELLTTIEEQEQALRSVNLPVSMQGESRHSFFPDVLMPLADASQCCL